MFISYIVIFTCTRLNLPAVTLQTSSLPVFASRAFATNSHDHFNVHVESDHNNWYVSSLFFLSA